MIRELLHTVYNAILHNQNQFASGGILLMALGSLIATLRSVPLKIWTWIVHQTTVTITVTDDQKAYYWTKLWLENQRIMKRTRHMDVYNKGARSYAVVPAPGHHWMLYRGRILSATFFRSEEKAKMAGGISMTTRSESITLKTLGRKQEIFRKLMDDVFNQFVKQEEKKPELYAWGSWGEWQEIHAFQPRKIDTVILPEEDKDRVIQEIVEFKARKEWYAEMGIPYRKGFLFYGPPGTGKTSLVAGLSAKFNANIYILKLADMTDTSLMESSKTVEPNSFIIVEDVDGVHASHSRTRKVKSKTDKNGVTLSGLLNVMDGLLSPYGAIFILTTNHKEALDAALIRPGRVDLQLLITYANAKQKQTLYNRFFEGTCPQKYLDKRMTMADLQQVLMVDKRGVN